MGYNKFITADGLVLLDLTADTVTANKLPKGITTHDRSGQLIIGTAEVNSAIPTEVSTEAEMTALLTSGEVGGVYKYMGTTGTYENGALYVLEEEQVTFSIVNPLNGGTVKSANASGATATYQYEFSGGTPTSVTVTAGGKSATSNTEVALGSVSDDMWDIGFTGYGWATVSSTGLITVGAGDGGESDGAFNIPMEISFSDGTNTVTDTFIAAGHGYLCFVEGTQILLADGTMKAVENITYDDELLVWDFYNGNYATAKPSWIMVPQEASYYYAITLSNGTVIKLVGSNRNCHRVFSVTKNKFEYATRCVGDEIYTTEGIFTLVSCEKIEETVRYYNLMTEKYYNCFANGILTCDRHGNMYDIENMKYCSNSPNFTKEELAEREAICEKMRLPKKGATND